MKRATIPNSRSRRAWSAPFAPILRIAVLALVVLHPATGPVLAAEDSDAPAGSGSGPGRVECDDAPAVFDPLCKAYDLMVEHYVDPVDASVLGAGAADAVREAGLSARTDGVPPPCPLPAAHFEETCVAVDDVADTAAAVEAAIRGMVRSLDPDSYYLTAAQYDRFTARLDNQGIAGLGLAFGLLEGDTPCSAPTATCRPVITEVYAGSPAARAGLMVGDVLVELGDAFPADLTCPAVTRLDRFAAGEEVTVTVRRVDRTMSFDIRAAELTIPIARSRVVGDTGYLRLDSFGAGVHAQASRAMGGLAESMVRGLVLDLRGNPGGYLWQAALTAALFLPYDSVVAVTETRGEREVINPGTAPVAPDPGLLPMVVMVDRHSASASEVLAGALGDHGRAIVVGGTTYGKDTGQVAFRLRQSGAVVGVLGVTTLRWRTPLSRSAAGGIEPDVAMDLPSCLVPDEAIRRAIDAIRPRVAGIAITSAPRDGSSYSSGQTIEATVAFSSRVSVVRNGGSPLLELLIGDEARHAVYRSGSGATELVFEYLVLPGDADADGISIPADALRAGGAEIQLASGLAATLDHAALTDDPRHRIGAPRPPASFVDIEGGAHSENIRRIASSGITVGCNPPVNDRFCPDRAVTRAQMASFLARALELPPAGGGTFVDIEGNPHAENIARIASSGITLGCNPPVNDRFCPDRPVTRGEAASFLARALELPPAGGEFFVDNGRSVHAESIDRIAASGITLGCNPPANDRFCPHQTLTRAQLASLLARALTVIPNRGDT